jgi:hypothetical protein
VEIGMSVSLALALLLLGAALRRGARLQRTPGS